MPVCLASSARDGLMLSQDCSHNGFFTLSFLDSLIPFPRREQVASATLHILQTHYPDRLGKAVCYHAPVLFSLTWRVLSLPAPACPQTRDVVRRHGERQCIDVDDARIVPRSVHQSCDRSVRRDCSP